MEGRVGPCKAAGVCLHSGFPWAPVLPWNSCVGPIHSSRSNFVCVSSCTHVCLWELGMLGLYMRVGGKRTILDAMLQTGSPFNFFNSL